MKITLQSWYLARALGVTKQIPSSGTEYFEVVIEGGPKLFWPIDVKLRKELV